MGHFTAIRSFWPGWALLHACAPPADADPGFSPSPFLLGPQRGAQGLLVPLRCCPKLLPLPPSCRMHNTLLAQSQDLVEQVSIARFKTRKGNRVHSSVLPHPICLPVTLTTPHHAVQEVTPYTRCRAACFSHSAILEIPIRVTGDTVSQCGMHFGLSNQCHLCCYKTGCNW